MECKKCGKVLPEKAKFCFECGAKVEQEVICDICGTKMPVGYRFCVECGSLLSVPVIDNFKSMKNDKIVENEAVQEPDWDSILKEFEETEDEMDGRAEISEIEPKLSDLRIADKDKYVTKHEAQQLIRKFGQIVGWKELKDLGEGCYYISLPQPDDYLGQYAILNLNNVEGFSYDSPFPYCEFYSDDIRVDWIQDLLWRTESPVLLSTDTLQRLEWISNVVDGKIICFENGYKEKEKWKRREEVRIIDVATGERKEICPKVSIRCYSENEVRIIIDYSLADFATSNIEEKAFYVFDENGKLILKIHREYVCQNLFVQFAEISCSGGRGCIRGMFDVITGNELLPMEYDIIYKWKKDNGNVLFGAVYPHKLDSIDFYEYDCVKKIISKVNIFSACSEFRITNGEIDVWWLTGKLKSKGYKWIDTSCE